MSCYIDIIRDEHVQGTEQSRSDWGIVTGNPISLKPAIFLDNRTGCRYSSIVGAIAYPAIEPGCVIVMGVSGDPKPAFTILEYREHDNIYQMIEQIVVDIRVLYAYGQHDAILQQWLGDPDRYLTLISKCSQTLEKVWGHDRGLYIREPVDWYETHAFPMYVRQTHTALAKKMLRLNKHSDLINRLQAFQPADADKGRSTDFPAVGMLGAMVHTLMIERPWEQDADHGEPIMIEGT